MTEEFLVSREDYLASGIHIGMKQHTKDMKPYVYKVRPDGLAVMNLQTIDKRIRIAAKFLAQKKKIIVVSRKEIAHKAIEKFSEIIGSKDIQGRFMPGMMTNPNYNNFYEADVVMVVDPMVDFQAIKEASNARVPVVAVCDTFNETTKIDLLIPANNKGGRAISFLFWLLTREILKERGKIESDDEFEYTVEDFVQKRVYQESKGSRRDRR